MRISEQHLKHWLEHGYAVVDGFLTPDELAVARAELSRRFPSREEYAYAPTLYSNDSRGGQMRELPYLGDILNFMALHPELISFAERALHTSRITLGMSVVWARYPGDRLDQALHVDYPTASILYPNARGPREEVEFILYYVDVDEQLGATYVVATEHSQDDVLVPAVRPQSQFPDLYRREQPIYVRAGGLLIYNLAIFHRASSITSRDRIRFSHHVMYRSEDAPWIGYRWWANLASVPEMQRFIEQASPRQRELVGFLPLGDAYWNEETLRGIAARYPNMDMMPYLEAADLPNERRDRLRESLRQPRSTDTGLAVAPDHMGESPAQGGEQSPVDLGYNYWRGIADYYALVTGVPTDYWLPWLMDLAYNYCRGIADYYALVTGVPADYWLSWLTTSYGLDAGARAA